MAVKYLEMDRDAQGNVRWKRTDKRPSDWMRGYLLKQAKEMRRHLHDHLPGDGYHELAHCYHVCLRGEDLRGEEWFGQFETSEGAVLAHVEDICLLAGIDYDVLVMQAYNRVMRASANDRRACRRAATLADIDAVMDDLEDINYHTLAHVLQCALEEWRWKQSRRPSVPTPPPGDGVTP